MDKIQEWKSKMEILLKEFPEEEEMEINKITTTIYDNGENNDTKSEKENTTLTTKKDKWKFKIEEFLDDENEVLRWKLLIIKNGEQIGWWMITEYTGNAISILQGDYGYDIEKDPEALSQLLTVLVDFWVKLASINGEKPLLNKGVFNTDSVNRKLASFILKCLETRINNIQKQTYNCFFKNSVEPTCFEIISNTQNILKGIIIKQIYFNTLTPNDFVVSCSNGDDINNTYEFIINVYCKITNTTLQVAIKKT